MTTPRVFVFVLAQLLFSLVLLARTTPIIAQSSITHSNIPYSNITYSGEVTLAQVAPSAISGYPPDPTGDIEWSGGYVSWDDVVAAFNNARGRENAMLGLSLGAINFPAADAWVAMSDGERALWLINEERTARGLAPLHGLEQNVTAVAQSYAEWLLANDQFDHNADGRSPWQRLEANAQIGACQDFLSIAENLFFIATTGATGIPLVIEQAIYIMLYADAGSNWGHRHAILWTPYTENSGAPDREGFVGIGRAHGSFTNPYNGKEYQNTDIIVMNFFDPCATWTTAGDQATPTPSPTSSPTASPTPSPTSSATPTLPPSPSPSPSATPTPTSMPTSIPTQTPPQEMMISGQVMIPAGDSPGGLADSGLADVAITSSDGQTTQTDDQGRFTLRGLQPKLYTLTPSKEGYVFVPASVQIDLAVDNPIEIEFMGSDSSYRTEIPFSLRLPLIMPER